MNNQIVSDIKDTRISLRYVISATLIAIIIVAAASVFAPSIVEDYSMLTESSYIVYKSGSTYYLRDGETGEITSSGTNASALINLSLDNYTVYTFKTPDGSYDPILLTHPILLANYTRFVTFKGEGNTGLIQLANGADCDAFQVSAGCHWIYWYDLYIHGNDAQQTTTSHGIHFLTGDTTTSDCSIKDCAIVNFNGSPIYVEGTLSASYINDNYIEDSAGPCIRIGGMHGTTVKHNILWNSEYGIRVDNTTRPRQDNAYLDNIINAMTETGIFINQSHNNQIRGNRINNCTQGMYLNVMYYSDISDNWVISSNETGILMYSLQFCGIKGNQVYGSSQLTNATYSGMIIGGIGTGQCDSNMIDANLVSNANWDNKLAYGIFLSGTYNSLTDSYCTGAEINISQNGATNEVHSCFNGSLSWIT